MRAARAGPGQEPFVGSGQARQLGDPARPGAGAAGAAAPERDRAVHRARAGPVRRRAADAAHQPAVHRPQRGAAPGPRRRGAAPRAGQGPVCARRDRRLPGISRCPAHGRPSSPGRRAGLPGRRGRPDPIRPAHRPRHRRRAALRRRARACARRAGAPGRAGPGPLPPAADRGCRVHRRGVPDRRHSARAGQHHQPADPIASRRDRPAAPGHLPAARHLASRRRGPARPATAFMHAAGITCSQRPGDLLADLEPAAGADAVRLPGAARP